MLLRKNIAVYCNCITFIYYKTHQCGNYYIQRNTIVSVTTVLQNH